MNKPLLIVLVLLLSSTVANACIWDRDTLAMERARFPEVNELIVGYFPRHSSAYYQWRLDQVNAIPIEQRTAADYDDLGASYDKLGQHGQAIQTMLDKTERFPDEGVYETHANLGTFYIHNGDLEQGGQYIGSAIEINPDAHFGREVYQKLLVEYVIQQRAAGNTLPLTEEYAGPLSSQGPGFAVYVLEQQGMADGDSQMEEIERATQGVLGMMRFGNHDSPVLLEALGDLLVFRFGRNAPQRLTVRAYLKASYETDDPDASALYRSKAERALGSQEGASLKRIESELKQEVAEGEAYFAKIEADEKAWIDTGADVDAKFNEAYYDTDPALTQSVVSKATDRVSSLPLQEKVLFALIGMIVLCVVIFFVKPLFRRKRIA